MIYIFPLIGFLVGLGPGLVLARKGQSWVVGVFVAMAVGVGVWMTFEGRAQTNGYDAIGYGIVVMLMIAPAVAGLIAGAIWGLVVRARSGQRAPHDGDTP